MTATLELIEVAEGRWLAADCCTAEDLEAAQQVAAEVERLREDCEAMLPVPDDLRERLSLGGRGLPATRSLHAEMAAIVRPAG
jgi:hypothetical protein